MTAPPTVTELAELHAAGVCADLSLPSPAVPYLCSLDLGHGGEWHEARISAGEFVRWPTSGSPYLRLCDRPLGGAK